MKSKMFFVSLLLSLYLIIPTYVFALDFGKYGTEVVYESQQITNLDVLKDRAEKGITDDNNYIVKLHLYNDSHIVVDGKEYKIKPTSIKSTSQKIRTIKNSIGIQVNTYVLSIFVTLSMSGPYTDSRQGPDTNNVVELYTSMTYNYSSGTSGSSSYNMYDILSVSGRVIRIISPFYALDKFEIGDKCSGRVYASPDLSQYIETWNQKTYNYIPSSPTVGTTYSMADPAIDCWVDIASGSGVYYVSSYTKVEMRQRTGPNLIAIIECKRANE